MSGPGYPAARTVAPLIAQHFARHLSAVPAVDVAPMVLPEADAIEAIVDAAFWASLRREEGYEPRISLALLAPELAVRPLRFAKSLPLSPAALVRVAPAVERPGIHLGVWREGGELRVW